MKTWRSDPFLQGRHYRVLRDFKSLRDEFYVGEVMIYQDNAYTAYHGYSGFFFLDTKNQSRSWDIHDDDPMEIWSELFELID